MAIVVSHPIQHFCPLYRALAETEEIDLKVFFASRAGYERYFDKDFNREISWQAGLIDGFCSEFLPGAEKERDLTQSISNGAVQERLGIFRPDVVQVYGFHHGVSRQAIAWARRAGKPVLLVSDSELRGRLSILTRLRKRLTVPIFQSWIDAYLTLGDCNEEYYRAYGARPEQFFRSPCPIDESSLSAALLNRDELRASIRGRWGIPEGKLVAIVVGKLTSWKCPAHALEAMALLRERSAQVKDRLCLLLAGDGPEMDRLRELGETRCRGSVTLAGFVEAKDLPAYYVASDYLVQCSSRDHHPLVTSEAGYCGLPMIVSDRVGSVGPTDDVRLGENGIEYPCGEVGRLADAMERMTMDAALRVRMGLRSAEIGQERTMAQSVKGYLRAIEWVQVHRARTMDGVQ